MYELKNGILYKNEVPEFTVGTSYFASFHPNKYPVAPGKERYKEAVKDLADIADFGFNVVRIAAFEKIEQNKNSYNISMPFIDHMINEMHKNDMAAIVRLQGYTMNLKKRENAVLCKLDGKEVNKNDVSVFIYDNFFNNKLVEDIKEATASLAKHFDNDTVVGYQVYNEPYLAGSTFCPMDYSKSATEAYKKYTSEAGKEAVPPLKFSDETKEEWIKYRLFVTKRFMSFLGELNDAGDRASDKKESTTNFTACPTWHHCAHFSVNYFEAAKHLDYMGIDIYDPLKGGYAHYIKALMAMVESAAALEGKNAQVMEFCCRTHMTAEDFERELSIAVGTGYKGVNFYAWRSDISGPEGGLGGIIYNDRSKTEKFDEAKKAVAAVKSIGNKIVTASKLREGIGIFESEYARHNSDLTEQSVLISVGRDVYRDIYEQGFSADYVDAEHLLGNNLGIEMLFVPDYSLLSEEEKNIVSVFAKEHYVFLYELGVGYTIHDNCGGKITNEKMSKNFCWKIGVKSNIGDWRFRICELFEILGKKPVVISDEKDIDIGVLQADDKSYLLIALTNIHSLKKQVDAFELKISGYLGEFAHATFYTKDGKDRLDIENGTLVKIPGLKTSGYIILER